MHYGDVCFLFRPDKYDPWDRARHNCLEEGGDGLASILSEAENTFISSQLVDISESPVSRPTWIGLIQTDENGDYFTKFVWRK